MNELIERYVAAAQATVPEKQRTEVGTEIRGAIGEIVAQHTDEGAPEDTAVRAALTELGDPTKFAESYRDRPQYLIGPAWYPSYIKMLKIIAGIVLPIVAGITVLEAIADDGAGMVDMIASAAESVIWAAGMVLFWSTLGFAIAERTGSPTALDEEAKPWSVDDLPVATGGRQIGLWDVLPSVAILVLFGVLGVMQSARGVGFFVRGDFADSYDHLPVINPDLGTGWVIGFFGLLAISVAVEVMKYLIGSWTRPVFVAVVAEAALWIIYAVTLARSVQVVNPELVQKFDEGNVDWWAAGGPANSLGAAIVVAISLWDVWEAWQEHRKYEQERQFTSVSA